MVAKKASAAKTSERRSKEMTDQGQKRRLFVGNPSEDRETTEAERAAAQLVQEDFCRLLRTFFKMDSKNKKDKAAEKLRPSTFFLLKKRI